MGVLEKIIDLKKRSLPSEYSLKYFNPEKSKRDFKQAITKNKDHRVKLIAELKRKSPSKGDINTSITVQDAWKLYSPYASALSILTETNFFGGSLEDLKKMDKLSNIPLLRKDFITQPAQIKETRIYGADAYLLIMAAMSKNQLKELLHAGYEYNMPALVEVHNRSELEMALDAEISILGINNRDLNDLSIDLRTTKKLINYIPEQYKKKLIIISESGLEQKRDIDNLPNQVSAVLVGTSIMNAQSPVVKLKELFSKIS